MSELSADQRLSQIQTLWSTICQAHGGGPTHIVNAAQERLLERYGKVVHRYLLGALRNEEAAQELSQEFALRFLRGALEGADKERGRFRDFLKGVLFHLIVDYHRRQKKEMPTMPSDYDPAAGTDSPTAEIRFVESWKAELLNRAWKGLAEIQEQTGQPFHAVLLLRAEKPDLRSEQMAEQLSRDLEKPVTAAWVRQNLHRAREKFAEMLVEEVLQTLATPTLDELEQELIDTGLLEYCRPALERLKKSEPPGAR